MQNIYKIPIAIDFFKDNKLVDIYYAMSRGIKENLEKNRQVGYEKCKYLNYSYRLIYIIAILLVIISILFALRFWLTINK